MNPREMVNAHDVELIVAARHADPFSVLGLHDDGRGGWSLRAFLPGADGVTMLEAASGEPMLALERVHRDGFFDGAAQGGRPAAYRLGVRWADGRESVLDDPYRFGFVLGEMDLWLLADGSQLRPFEVLGANPRTMEGTAGTAFAVWAPNASRVAVVGDFNRWDGRVHPMRLRRECGVWELFLPGVAAGARYKYELHAKNGARLPLKADPYGRAAELRPSTASVVAALPPPAPPSRERRRANALDAPISIYEVHAGSWRRHAGAHPFPTWDGLADSLLPYAQDMGFTHVELLPVSEHPSDGSWGYEPIGLYAPSARFGPPEGFRRFVERAHEIGLGVLIDWPPQFPSDPHGLARFDGTPLYERAERREAFPVGSNTPGYDFARREVFAFLVGNALYWLERYGVDGLRIDALASMLYQDYGRAPGAWLPNADGGRENLEAIAFLQRMNRVVDAERPQAATLAEESTAFPAVSRPVDAGGLGFRYKWNMGWMHDTLAYMRRDPLYRRHHHQEITFGLVYAFHENFVLPLSHDEVAPGKGSLLARMPGERRQRFANLRAYYGFMFGHPGKKLLFMGGEFAQEREWDHDASLDWPLLADPLHDGVRRLVRDLNRCYREMPALHEVDFEPAGFEWIDAHDAERSTLAFARFDRAREALVVVACNFAAVARRGFRLGVPRPGEYAERLNTDSGYYGGGNVGTPHGGARADGVPAHGRAQSIVIDLPPLATVFLQWRGSA